MPKKRSFFVYFDITRDCMEHGLKEPGDIRSHLDVLDRLAFLMRRNPEVRKLLSLVADGTFDKCIIGVGREIETSPVEDTE